jgi:hypothetical protein
LATPNCRSTRPDCWPNVAAVVGVVAAAGVAEVAAEAWGVAPVGAVVAWGVVVVACLGAEGWGAACPAVVEWAVAWGAACPGVVVAAWVAVAPAWEARLAVASPVEAGSPVVAAVCLAVGASPAAEVPVAACPAVASALPASPHPAVGAQAPHVPRLPVSAAVCRGAFLAAAAHRPDGHRNLAVPPRQAPGLPAEA